MSVYHKPRPPLKSWLILRLADWSWDWLETKARYFLFGGNWTLVIFFWHVPQFVLPTKKFPQTIPTFVYDSHAHCHAAALIGSPFFLRINCCPLVTTLDFQHGPYAISIAIARIFNRLSTGKLLLPKNAPQGSEDWHKLIFPVNATSLTCQFLTFLAILVPIPCTF